VNFYFLTAVSFLCSSCSRCCSVFAVLSISLPLFHAAVLVAYRPLYGKFCHFDMYITMLLLLVVVFHWHVCIIFVINCFWYTVNNIYWNFWCYSLSLFVFVFYMYICMYVYVKSSNSHVAGGIWTEEKEKRSKTLITSPHYFIFICAIFIDERYINLYTCLPAYRWQLCYGLSVLVIPLASVILLLVRHSNDDAIL